jgi:hypothetical protein
MLRLSRATASRIRTASRAQTRRLWRAASPERQPVAPQAPEDTAWPQVRVKTFEATFKQENSEQKAANFIADIGPENVISVSESSFTLFGGGSPVFWAGKSVRWISVWYVKPKAKAPQEQAPKEEPKSAAFKHLARRRYQ